MDIAQGWFSSTLDIDGTRYDTSQHMTTAGLTWAIGRRWAVRAAFGGVLNGTLGRSGERYILGPGVVGSLNGRYRILHPKGGIPFVDGSFFGERSFTAGLAISL